VAKLHFTSIVHPVLAAFTAALCAGAAWPASFAVPGAPEPSRLQEVRQALDREPASLELLLSFGTSKGGSAGHLALSLRDDTTGEDTVYSANFYADRDPRHAAAYYTDALIARVPKWEYLYGTTSSLGPKAAFGLDYGEVYKRSVAGVRVFGVPAAERRALAAYLERMNVDFAARAVDTQYHRGEVKYGYLDLNCAKTIGSAFQHGAGYGRLEIRSAPLIESRKAKAALNANTPSEMALQLLRELHARGYRMEAVLYRKSPGSPYVDPLEEERVAFGDLPNRFPSAISLDFRNDEGHYEDYDNLFAMYLLFNLARWSVDVDPAAGEVALRTLQEPLPYAEAARLAAAHAEHDSKGFLRRLLFRPRGKGIG
jgi:hypothetical protein